MKQKSKDAIELFKNPTQKNCIAMITKYSKESLPNKNDPNSYEYDYKRQIQELICDIFQFEMVEYNLFFTVNHNFEPLK